MTTRNEPDWPLPRKDRRTYYDDSDTWNDCLAECKEAFTSWQAKQPKSSEDYQIWTGMKWVDVNGHNAILRVKPKEASDE